MKQQIDRLENKVDKLDNRLDSIDKTLVKQEGNLDIHMYRTKIAEKRLEHIENNLEPIKAHVSRMDGALKLLGIVSTIAGIAAIIWRFII